jgi:hypothetical protein
MRHDATLVMGLGNCGVGGSAAPAHHLFQALPKTHSPDNAPAARVRLTCVIAKNFNSLILVNADGQPLQQWPSKDLEALAMNELREYHLRRARSERHLADRSCHARAFDAHMGLWALHLKRLELLDRKVADHAPDWSTCLGTDN